MSPFYTHRRLELLEKVTGPRHGAVDVDDAWPIEITRRASFALRRAAEPDASADITLAAQKIAELIGSGGHFSPDSGSAVARVLERELAPVLGFVDRFVDSERGELRKGPI